MNITLTRLAAKDARVADCEDLGPDEESRYWLHLAQGWYSPQDGSHTITGRTIRETRDALSQVVRCVCTDCLPPTGASR